VAAATSTSSRLFLADDVDREPADVMLPFIAPPPDLHRLGLEASSGRCCLQ
jgi:hypothetical protein